MRYDNANVASNSTIHPCLVAPATDPRRVCYRGPALVSENMLHPLSALTQWLLDHKPLAALNVASSLKAKAHHRFVIRAPQTPDVPPFHHQGGSGLGRDSAQAVVRNQRHSSEWMAHLLLYRNGFNESAVASLSAPIALLTTMR